MVGLCLIPSSPVEYNDRSISVGCTFDFVTGNNLCHKHHALILIIVFIENAKIRNDNNKNSWNSPLCCYKLSVDDARWTLTRYFHETFV